MKARQIDVGGSRVDLRATSSTRTAMGRRRLERLPGKQPILKQSPATADDRSATVWSRCDGLRPFSPASRWSPSSSSASRRRAETTARTPRKDALRPRRGATRARRCACAAGRAARAVQRAARRRPAARSASGSRSSRATPSWSTSGPRGAAPCRTEFPLFQSPGHGQGKEVAFLGLNAGDSTDPARRFLRAHAAAVPVLRRPRRGHRQDDPGAGELPDHGLLRPRAASSPTCTRAATGASPTSSPT